jgi:hypothetical protein
MHQGSTCKVFVRNLFTEFPNGFDQHVRSLPKTGTAYALFKQERPMLMQLLGPSFSLLPHSSLADSPTRRLHLPPRPRLHRRPRLFATRPRRPPQPVEGAQGRQLVSHWSVARQGRQVAATQGRTQHQPSHRSPHSRPVERWNEGAFSPLRSCLKS